MIPILMLYFSTLFLAFDTQIQLDKLLGEGAYVKEIPFTNQQRGYTVTYPSNWTQNKKIEGFDLFLTAPIDESGQSKANLSIVSGPIPEQVDLELYTSENMKNLLRGNHTVKIIGSGNATINGLNAKWVQYIREDDQTEIIHYFLIVDKVGYLITGAALVGSFDQFQNVIDNFVKSFKIKS